MANFIRKLVRRGKRRKRSGNTDGKAHAMYEAAVRLLVTRDYEHISMAKLAKEAGVSIGAVYSRFTDKDAFLYHIISRTFRLLGNDADRSLAPGSGSQVSTKDVAESIVRHVVQSLTSAKATGVIRATLKHCTTKPDSLEPFTEYRKLVSEHAVALLANRLEIDHPARTIRIGLQVVFATVIDAMVHKDTVPLKAGSARMTAALSRVFIGYLGISDDGARAGDEADDEDKPLGDAPFGTEKPPKLLEGQVAVIDPDLRLYKGPLPYRSPKLSNARTSTSTKQARPTETAPKVTVVKPPKVPLGNDKAFKPKAKRKVQVI